MRFKAGQKFIDTLRGKRKSKSLSLLVKIGLDNE